MIGRRYKKKCKRSRDEGSNEYKKIPLRNIFVLMLICLMAISVFSFMLKFKTQQKIENTSSTIANKLEELSEISSLKYNYTSVVGIQEHLSFDKLKIPFTEKSFLLQYNGYVKFGTDLSKAKIDIDRKLSHVSIDLNNCAILDSVVDMNNLTVYDEKWTIFNKLSTQEVIDEIAKDQKNKEGQLLKDGYIEESNSKISVLVREMLYSMGFEKVDIKFS